MIPVQFPQPDVKVQPWGEETLLARTDKYTLKKLLYRAGKAGGLQIHEVKLESFHMHSGDAWVDYDAGDGTLTRIRMRPGQTVHVPPGAVHRVEAIEDSLFYEASTPVENDRRRMEAAYDVTVAGNQGPGLPSTW